MKLRSQLTERIHGKGLLGELSGSWTLLAQLRKCVQYRFCVSSTEPTFALSSTRLQRWHMTWFQPSPRCICLRCCRKETLILCLFGCQTLLELYEHDDNVLSLLEAMHDAFDFAHHEDTLKSIKPDSKQAEILTMMLRDVCSCSDF